MEERGLGGGGAEEKVRGPGWVYRAGAWSELQPAGEERLLIGRGLVAMGIQGH